MPLCLERDLGSVCSSLNRNGTGGELSDCTHTLEGALFSWVLLLASFHAHGIHPDMTSALYISSAWYTISSWYTASPRHTISPGYPASAWYTASPWYIVSSWYTDLTMVHSLTMVHRSHHGSQPQYGTQPQHAIQSYHSLQPPMVYSPTVALWDTDLSWCIVSHDRQSPVIGGLTTEYSLTVVYGLPTYIASLWDSDSLTTGHSLTRIHSLTWYTVSRDLQPHRGIQLYRGLQLLSIHNLPVGHSLSIVHNPMEPPGFRTCSFLRIPHQSRHSSGHFICSPVLFYLKDKDIPVNKNLSILLFCSFNG